MYILARIGTQDEILLQCSPKGVPRDPRSFTIAGTTAPLTLKDPLAGLNTRFLLSLLENGARAFTFLEAQASLNSNTPSITDASTRGLTEAIQLVKNPFCTDPARFFLYSEHSAVVQVSRMLAQGNRGIYDHAPPPRLVLLDYCRVLPPIGNSTPFWYITSCLCESFNLWDEGWRRTSRELAWTNEHAAKLGMEGLREVQALSHTAWRVQVAHVTR